MDMRTEGIETRKGTKPPKGRKDSEGQEAVTRPQIVSERADELVELLIKSELAATEYGDAVKKCAEDSGYNASNVRKFIAARAGDKFEEKKRNCEQQMELFDEVGSVPRPQ